MHRLAPFTALFFILGCGADACSCWGYTARNNEVSGQVKRVIKTTPILCNDMAYVDLSLGALQDGVGSISKEDMFLLIQTSEQLKFFEAHVGDLVKVTYDRRRMVNCPDHDAFVVSAELVGRSPVVLDAGVAATRISPEEGSCVKCCPTVR